MGENRYVSLTKKDPALAESLFAASAQEALQRRNTLKQIVAAQQTKYSINTKHLIHILVCG
jgi:hypothetical protein